MINDMSTERLYELRPCIVGGQKALFHCWTQESWIHTAVLRGDVSGAISTTMAIIEFEDGSVRLAKPHEVKFCDIPVEGYYFGKEELNDEKEGDFIKAKDYLKQLEKLAVVIRQKQDEIQQLRSSATSIGSVDISGERVQGGKVATDAHYVNELIKIHELEGQAQKERGKFLQKKHDIINQIHALNNSKHIEILYKHYVEFKRLEVVSVEMNYSYQYIVELHGYALKNFQTTYENLLKTYI